MKKLLIIMFIVSVSYSAFAQEKVKNESEENSNTVMNEITVKTEASRDFDGKVFEMEYYYGCKFSREDERMAVIDGYILFNPVRIDEIKRWVAKQHNVKELDVILISGKENSTYGAFEVCVAGIIYIYEKKGNREYHFERKSKPLATKKKA